MRVVPLLFIFALLAGCGGAAQTRNELKAVATEHPMLATVGTYTANRRFEDVAAMLERKWQECYSVRSTTTRTQGGMTTMNVQNTFHPQTRKVGNSLIEMTLQMTTQGMINLDKVPPGGAYQVALDVERLPGNKTKLSWYSMSGYSSSWERNKQWSEGKNVACDS